MLFSSVLEKKFWGEAVSTAVHLLNKCPSSSIDGEIPDERWYGGKVDYSNLRPFGCKAFAHIKQSKLEPRSLRCVMLGYQKGVKGYRPWCLELNNQEIVVSRVVFLEDQMPCLKDAHNTSERSQLVDNDFEVELELVPEMIVEHVEVDESADMSIGDQEAPVSEQLDDLSDYLLARDRVRRTNTRRPARYSDCEMLFFALNVAEQLQHSEPVTYSEASHILRSS